MWKNIQLSINIQRRLRTNDEKILIGLGIVVAAIFLFYFVLFLTAQIKKQYRQVRKKDGVTYCD